MKTLTTLTASAVFLVAAIAHANDPAAAEVLFRDGRTLLAQGNYPEACAKLEESERLDQGIGTLYHLADCHEHLGKTATAWAEFIEVASQAKLKGQHDREAAARKRSDALATRLPHLVLEGTAPRGAEIRRDSTVIGAAELGASIPVDPGTHKVTVRAPGSVAWEVAVTVREGATVRVKLPDTLQAVPVAVAPEPTAALHTSQPPAPAPATPLAEPVTSTRRPEQGNTQRNAGLVLAGAGLISIGAGTYFGIHSIDKRNESRGHCLGNVCDPDGVSMRSDALTAGNVSTVTFIAGGALLVGGGVLFFTSPPSQESHGTAQVATPPRVRLLSAAPYAGPNGGGVALTGDFL